MSEVTLKDVMDAIQDLRRAMVECSRISKRAAGTMEDRETSMENRLSNIEKRVINIETEMKDMKSELKQDIRKLGKKIDILTQDVMEVRTDMVILQEENN